MHTNVVPPPRRRWRRIIGRLFLALILVSIAVVAVSAIYNFWAFRHYRALYPPPGKLYSVSGYRMHLNCTGAGSPTIVLESGLGNDWMIWGQVQPVLEKMTRVCSYDRAGYGWSDARPGPRDANSIADQLHGLLSLAGITGPVVLMGHSIAGIYLRAYVAKHPQGISGLVLVDPSTPEQLDRMPPEVMELQRKTLRQLDWFRPFFALGIGRLAGQCADTDPQAPKEYAGWLKADNNCNSGLVETLLGEFQGLEASAAEVMHTGPFGEMPILIFSQDVEVKSPDMPEDLQRKVGAVWTSLHEDLKKLSPRTRRIIAKGSSHYVQRDRPELVNRETELFIRQIRGDAPQPTDFGSTKTE